MCAEPVDQKTIPSDAEEVVEVVKSRYGSIATGASTGCCGPQTGCCGDPAAAAAAGIGYRAVDLEILKDVDFLEAMGGALPQELADVAAATGVTPEDVKGIVRSVTYRAWKK
jgi:hypothetical protein